jgi:hypothetical protein
MSSARSNYETNTGHRFISKQDQVFKVHVHAPDDKVVHRSIGCTKIGDKEGLKKAIQIRNEIGKELWGKYWKRILAEPAIFTKLPHSLEPRLINKKNGPYYAVIWNVYSEDEEGNEVRKLKSKLFNINKLGKLSAYVQAKQYMHEIHKENIGILKLMGRFNVIEYK